MANSPAPSERRYAQIQERQGSPKWLSEYQPAMFAAREEASSISRPCKIHSTKLGRILHTFSENETDLLPLALYHPNMFDIHEQKVLSPIPCQHPLQNHPEAIGQNFPALRGTVSIAESLGRLEFHPKIYVEDPDNLGTKIALPFPWLGDFLIYMRGKHSLYCVNWSIKGSPEQFHDPQALGGPVKNLKKETEKLIARHLVEQIYYSDGGIQTHCITAQDYDEDVIANLRDVYSWHLRTTPFDSKQTEIIIDHFKAGLALRESPIDVIRWLMAQYRYQQYELKIVFYQAVWNRTLRVDLHSPLLVDRPMRPETSDILQDYSKWFAEER